MAGLSIARRRKAWLKGVAYGASGFGKCRYIVQKLKDIFQQGVIHGRLHIATPYVRAVVEQEQRRRRPERQPMPHRDRDRGRGFRQPRPRPQRPF